MYIKFIHYIYTLQFINNMYIKFVQNAANIL